MTAICRPLPKNPPPLFLDIDGVISPIAVSGPLTSMTLEGSHSSTIATAGLRPWACRCWAPA